MMKVDKGVCTTPAPKQKIGETLDDGVGAVDSPDVVEPCHTAGTPSKYVDKAERYGVVFSTLMENKMQAIKRQSSDYASAKKKRQQHLKAGGGGGSGVRISSKFIPSCVRRNSLSEQPTGSEGGDVEMGLIKGGFELVATGDECDDETTKETQAGCKSPIESEHLPDYHVDEVVSPQSKNTTSDLTSDNVSIQSANSIGTAFSIPFAPPLTPKPLSDARLRLLEAKSISAQASPVLPRMLAHPTISPFPSSCTTPFNEATKTIAMHPSSSSTVRQSVPSSSSGYEKPTKSPSSTFTITENLVNQSSEYNRIREPPASVIRTPSRFRPATATIVPTTAASSSHGGFISSFNELTSSNNLSNLININLPVTMSHHKMKAAPPASGSRSSTTTSSRRPSVATSAMLEYEQRMDRKWPYSSASEMMVADSGSVCSGRQEWKASRRKFRHRGSDPVLIYPSSSGLSQCLLTMPPNQSIQIKYDDNTLYDVSLELDRKSSKKNGAGTGGRKSTHRHHHDGYRHHRHHHSHRHDGEKRSRRHRKRILVHDLDTQRVKVIDPDDLSQRARWTIIATACLLLIMCLLLVGITLRMAPLIDDMVRQENERLMKESYERGRFLQNLTDDSAESALIIQP